MDDLVPMLVSMLLGTAVGWERQLGRKPAGLRTHTLVCLGSTMFVLLGRHASAVAPGMNYDPTRIIHGVATGVGFLGAGAIIRREGMTHGLTTAASIWMSSAVSGSACSWRGRSLWRAPGDGSSSEAPSIPCLTSSLKKPRNDWSMRSARPSRSKR